jgi:hypothetical protein
MAAPPPVQLLVYAFGSGADFEGRLIGALERLESGGAMRILDALFVHRRADTGDLDAVNVKSDGAGSIAAPLLDFRLDESARRRATQKALKGRPGGIPPELVTRLGDTLEPGAAIAAVLVDHVWRRTLEDAVDRSSGTPLVTEFVHAEMLGELAPELIAASGSG